MHVRGIVQACYMHCICIVRPTLPDFPWAAASLAHVHRSNPLDMFSGYLRLLVLTGQKSSLALLPRLWSIPGRIIQFLGINKCPTISVHSSQTFLRNRLRRRIHVSWELAQHRQGRCCQKLSLGCELHVRAAKHGQHEHNNACWLSNSSSNSRSDSSSSSSSSSDWTKCVTECRLHNLCVLTV